MKITADTPDMLILRFTRWKAPVIYAAITFMSLWVAARIAASPDIPFGVLLIWLGVTALWTLPMTLIMAEKSMLVLNATTGEADFRHRTIRGLHRHTWPLNEVQSTRVTRYRNNGPAIEDPKRIMTLYVRTGMDEGRHKLTKHMMPADDVLAASARVSDWMKDWRAKQDVHVDSRGAKP